MKTIIRTLVSCIGKITEHHGGKAASFATETCSLFVKTLKGVKDIEIDVKYNAIIGLANVLNGVGKSIRELTAKDLLKIARTGLADKVPLLRAASAEVRFIKKLLERLYTVTGYGYPLTKVEFEKELVSLCKQCESRHRLQMNAFASLIFAMLISSQRLLSSFPSKKTIGDEGIEDRTILTVEEMLSFFRFLYIKNKFSYQKVVIIESYCLLYRTLGVQFIENNYGEILDLFLTVSDEDGPSIDGYDFQSITSYMLRDAVGKMLSESGQIRACRELVGKFQDWSVEKSYLYSEKTLICILVELESLVRDLGPATRAVDEEIVSTTMKLLDHQSYAVKLRLASFFRVFCLAMPVHITPFMNKLSILIQRDIGFMNPDNPSSINRLEGYIHSLSAIIATIPHHKLYAAIEDAGTIFGLATQLLKSHRASNDFRLQLNQAQMSWTLIGSLMCLGKSFLTAHLSQLLLLWKDTFPRMTATEIEANRTELEWGYIIFKKDSALAAMENFLRFNGPEIVTPDIAKRLIVCLVNAQQLLSILPGAYGPLDTKTPSSLQKKLYDRECLLKARLFACFQIIVPSTLVESMFGNILRATIGTFAVDPDKIDRFLATTNEKDGAIFAAKAKDASTLCIESTYPTSLATNHGVAVATGSGAEIRNLSKNLDSVRGIEAHFQLVVRN